MSSPSPSPKKRIYLAGPMQGYPQFNFPRFNAVTKALRQGGHEVFNPAEKDIERHDGVDISADNPTGNLEASKVQHGFSLRRALAEDLHYICAEANTIVMLPGWEKSNGAQAEHRTAVALQSEGMEIVYIADELCEMMELAASIGEKASA
jgi:nucleoside 2-deoxyribosyltransferase